MYVDNTCMSKESVIQCKDKLKKLVQKEEGEDII